MGKVTILNYIGYSKLWHKAYNCIIPESLCRRPCGKTIDILKCLTKLSQGFIWGFNTKENRQELDFDNPKTPLISRATLNLEKIRGGTNL